MSMILTSEYDVPLDARAKELWRACYNLDAEKCKAYGLCEEWGEEQRVAILQMDVTRIDKDVMDFLLKFLKNVKRLYDSMIDIVECREIAHKAKMKERKVSIELPRRGKLISAFADEVVTCLKDKNILFFRADSHDIVEIGRIKQKKDGELEYTGFLNIKPHRFITLIEEFITPVIATLNGEEEKSMNADLANTLLCSPIMQDRLPLINRIFTVPIPILHDGTLTFPERGYDRRFDSWMPFDAPRIENENMGVEEAKEIIHTLLKEFCFEKRQDFINAISALLTPFLRGMFSNFSARTPVFFYIANRERAGKDYLAGLTGILYEGCALEEAPISTSENAKSDKTDELRKKVLSALISGRKRLHFANNKGYINNSVFEMIITARRYSDRILGRSEIISFENEMDFSLSGNVGVGFTPDLANRCRFIRLFLEIEDANSRKFENPNLHQWVEKNRGVVLSALYALVKNWVDRGMPKGIKQFSSFPEWASICGGIMETAGYESPCEQDKEVIAVGGDSETTDMKRLFEVCWERCPDMWLKKSDIREIIMEEDVFAYLDFSKKSDQTKFGNKLMRYVGRILSDIRLVVKDEKVRAARQEFNFTKNKQETLEEIFKSGDGNLGNLGNLYHPTQLNQKNIYKGKTLPRLPTLPHFEPSISQSTKFNTSNDDNSTNVIEVNDISTKDSKPELSAQNILNWMKQLNSEEVSIGELQEVFGDGTYELVERMKMEGLIFEPKIGWLKVMW